MVKKFAKYGLLALALAFIYTPILVLVIFSFTDSIIIGDWNGFSFKLYEKLFNDSDIMTIVRDTVLLAVGAGCISTILGTMGAIGIFYSKKRTANFLNVLGNIPIINAEIVTALALALMFAMVFTFANKTILSLVIGHVVISVPYVVLSVLPKLKQMDANTYEAALDLGATPIKALFSVVIPEILPGIVSGFMLALTLSLDDYIVTAFTKPDTFDTISTYVYNAVKVPTHSSLPALRALSAIIFLIIIVAVVVMNLRASKKGDNR